MVGSVMSQGALDILGYRRCQLKNKTVSLSAGTRKTSSERLAFSHFLRSLGSPSTDYKVVLDGTLS